MNVSLIKGGIVGAVLVTAGGAIAGYNLMEQPTPIEPQFAAVLQVTPATESHETSREVCEDVEVTRKQDPRDKHRVIGTATGAIVGGILGNQVGGGRGKTVATVVGAAAGGFAGNKAQERVQSDDVYTTTETRCETIVEFEDRVVGYDVTYQIGDEQGQTRMERDPGQQIQLVDGQLPTQSVPEQDHSS